MLLMGKVRVLWRGERGREVPSASWVWVRRRRARRTPRSEIRIIRWIVGIVMEEMLIIMVRHILLVRLLLAMRVMEQIIRVSMLMVMNHHVAEVVASVPDVGCKLLLWGVHQTTHWGRQQGFESKWWWGRYFWDWRKSSSKESGGDGRKLLRSLLLLVGVQSCCVVSKSRR